MKQLLILAAIALIATILTACRERETVRVPNGAFLYIDTFVIHGHPHEYIHNSRSASHSPECWCLKGGNLQPIEKLEHPK